MKILGQEDTTGFMQPELLEQVVPLLKLINYTPETWAANQIGLAL